MDIIKRFTSLFSPEQYHGWGKTKNYFEGWYYKIVNPDETKAFAFIPGIAMADNGQKQAFIQVLDGINKSAEFYKYDINEFIPDRKKFNIRILNNTFSINKIQLDLPSVEGHLKFSRQIPWPTSFTSPGIMGPYSFVPFMECYHGILSMDHSIDGELKINNEKIDFTGGRGYMEKDWGKSFPSAYTWMQTNHFSQPGISFKSSVAKIPWMGSSFVGFIAGVWLNDQLYQFTSYNSSKLMKCFVNKKKVELVMENRSHRLEIFARREDATALASPIMGLMDGKIEESMCSEIEIRLIDKKGKTTLLEDKGRNAALEVAGNIEELIK